MGQFETAPRLPEGIAPRCVRPGSLATMSSMDAHRQKTLGLALLALVILLFVLLRRAWSGT